MLKKKTLIASLLPLLLLCASMLVACKPQPAPTTQEPTSTFTPEVTATATPSPARIVLLDPGTSTNPEVITAINEFAAANSLVFETIPAFNGDLDNVKILIALSGLDNAVEVAASAPQTQFLVNSSAVSAAANLSTIGTNPVHLAFMAGYLAAMTSSEWRAGALLADPAQMDAFTNGGAYLCGRCIPKYGPILIYPQVYSPSGPADEGAWVGLAQALWTDTNANSIYIDPAADAPQVLDAFNTGVLYSSNPSSPNLARYTAILGADADGIIPAALPDLLAGNGGKVYTAPVSLLLINNPDVVTPAKQENFKQVALDLAEDRINPLSVP